VGRKDGKRGKRQTGRFEKKGIKKPQGKLEKDKVRKKRLSRQNKEKDRA